jgi:hypothetical protein
MQGTQNRQNDLETEQSWRTNESQIQNFSQSYGNQDSVVLV